MTATEELRALLDMRGVEWTAHDNAWVNETYWKDASGKPVWASERVITVGNIAPSGLVQKQHTTPAQAVEDTLGRGTCYDKGNIERFICSECGCRLKLQDDEWEPTMWLDDGAATVPRFCPWCGRKVVDE